MEGSNPALNCNIGASEISVKHGRAFFEDITVNDNSTLLKTSCRVRGQNLYTIMCFHHDHTELEEGSGGSTTLFIILACLILILIGIAIVLFSKLKKERGALEKERTAHEETKKLLSGE